MRRGWLLGLGLLASAPAWAQDVPEKFQPPSVGSWGVGDLDLKPGMMLYLLRPDPAASDRLREVGRMKVLELKGGQANLELIDGESEMQTGDQLEFEASSPRDWEPMPASSVR